MRGQDILISASIKPVDPAFYPEGLAYAVHFSYQRLGEAPQPLNWDYGTLFAKGSVSTEDTIVPVSVCDSSFFAMTDGWIGIQGNSVDESGKATGSVLPSVPPGPRVTSVSTGKRRTGS